MRYLILIFLPYLAIFLQSTFFGSYSIKGVIPDLLLIFVVFYALFNSAEKSAVYGFFCGLLEDLYLGRFIGINALSKAITAYLIGRFQVFVFNENLFVGIFAIITGTVINSFLIIILSFLSFKMFNIEFAIFINIIYQTIYNSLLAMPVYLWYYNSTRKGFLR